jgi:hypothetical protein
LNSLHNKLGKCRRAWLILSKRSIIALGLLVTALVVFYPLAIRWQESKGTLTRRLAVGDSWNYNIVFPDSESYQLTESVRGIIDLNGTETYMILRDDPHHISTQYLWITFDWHEVKTFTPAIGNLIANSTTTYKPPVQLFQVPFHVGDQWNVKSTVLTITKLSNTTINSTALLLQFRTTSSLDDVSTPFGKFHAFKVIVMQNGTLSETLWFDTGLGQVVYGEFYNDHEKVTQSMIGYNLNPVATSATESAFVALVTDTWVFRHGCGRAFANYI